jgi:prophage DNA circulation protein
MNLDEALAGTYKGVPFMMASGTVTGGNKNVVHSYPNSNRQTVENLGQTPRSFPVSIILSSDGYVAKRDALLAAFEDGKPGPLVHPFHGRVENVIAGPYTLSEDFTSLGSGTISVTFLVHNGPGVPQAAAVTVSAVSAANGVTSGKVQTNFGAKFKVTPSYLGSFEAATASVQDSALAFKKSLAPLDEASEYLAAAEKFSTESAALIMAPANLALRITGMFEQATTLFDDPLNALKHYSGFFGFGDTATRTIPVTAAQIQAAQNKAVYDSAMNVQALGYAYLSSVQIDYDTVDDVDATIDAIEAQYQSVILSEGLDTDTREALTDLRHTAMMFLDTAKLSARRVVNVRMNPTTARLLAFRYYGNDDQGEALVNLNAGNVSNLSGDVKVLTE